MRLADDDSQQDPPENPHEDPCADRRHEPELTAARWLAGDLDAVERADVAAHLAGCPACWDEVEAGRRGRTLAESARVAAGPDLRERLRGLVEAEPAGQPRRPLRRRSWAVPVAAALVVGVALVALPRGPAQPAALAAAVRDFTARDLPGRDLPDLPQPDLSALRLQPVGAGGGAYDGLAVDGYAYRDPAGRRLVVYLSQQPFPEAPDAVPLAGPDGPWLADRGEVVLLCARVPHALLLVGQDRVLVRRAADLLGVL